MDIEPNEPHRFTAKHMEMAIGWLQNGFECKNAAKPDRSWTTEVPADRKIILTSQ
jgi:hypothetical protein